MLNNFYAKLVIIIALYFLSFSSWLLQFNTILIGYIGVPDGFLYIVMLEHFTIAMIFGLFWQKFTGLKQEHAVKTALLLPISFFVIAFISEYFSPSESENEGYLLVMSFLAVSQLTGVILGSFNSYRISAA